MKELVREICELVLAKVDCLNQMDAVCGDGECGSNLGNGARKLLESIEECDSLSRVGLKLNAAGCGTLGTLISLLLIDLSRARSLEEGAQIAKDSLIKRSGTTLGQKTMVDSLMPWLDGIIEGLDLFECTVLSHQGARDTLGMPGGAGRGKYVGDGSIGTMDPGAYIVALTLEKVADYLRASGHQTKEIVIEEDN